jgi:enterochelin esterase-like enzyme
VKGVVPWVDAHLSTIKSPKGRVLAGLSAGGFGAFDIGLRHPEVFGRLASWSGYFHPMQDAPFAWASRATVQANDPRLLVKHKAARLRREGMRFFVSTGPRHNQWDPPLESFAFAAELRRLRLPVQFVHFRYRKGHWRNEFQAGMRWAFGT